MLAPRILSPMLLRRVTAHAPPRPVLMHHFTAACTASTLRLSASHRALSTQTIAPAHALGKTVPPPPIQEASRFAVVDFSGTQYKVAVGDLISSELIPVEVNRQLDLGRVLLVGERDATVIGSPLITGASVTVTCEEQAYADKVIVFKKNRRKGYRRWKGYRARLTLLRINSINLPPELEAQLAAEGK